MDARGEVALLDKHISLLMTREKLSEEEVKALCEKVGLPGCGVASQTLPFVVVNRLC